VTETAAGMRRFLFVTWEVPSQPCESSKARNRNCPITIVEARRSRIRVVPRYAKQK
jgi:hypothetical protein